MDIPRLYLSNIAASLICFHVTWAQECCSIAATPILESHFHGTVGKDAMHTVIDKVVSLSPCTVACMHMCVCVWQSGMGQIGVIVLEPGHPFDVHKVAGKIPACLVVKETVGCYRQQGQFDFLNVVYTHAFDVNLFQCVFVCVVCIRCESV